MSDEAAIRRTNLKALCKQRGWSIKDLAEHLTWARYSYWRDLLENPAKSFGEKVARRIEETLDLGRGWLDEPNAVQAHRPSRVREALPAPPADFSDRREVSASDWALLQDVKTAATQDELDAIRTRADMIKRRVDEMIAERMATAADAENPKTGKK